MAARDGRAGRASNDPRLAGRKFSDLATEALERRMKPSYVADFPPQYEAFMKKAEADGLRGKLVASKGQRYRFISGLQRDTGLRPTSSIAPNALGYVVVPAGSSVTFTFGGSGSNLNRPFCLNHIEICSPQLGRNDAVPFCIISEGPNSGTPSLFPDFEAASVSAGVGAPIGRYWRDAADSGDIDVENDGPAFVVSATTAYKITIMNTSAVDIRVFCNGRE